jgi:uncharacterized cupredoxin-like copper-binding protein
MKTFIAMMLAAAVSLVVVRAAEQEKNETLGQKTSEAWDTTKEKTREAARDVADLTKKAADTVTDALTPEGDARKVEVKLSEHAISMPTKLESGKTAFIVHNAGREARNFNVEGEGIDKKFFAPVDPDQTKVLHVDLKPGAYEVICPMKNHAKKGMKLRLTVK